jgi:excisionase family DNA binding protein
MITRHLTTEELAERLGGDFSAETVKRWRKTGDGPRFIRVGKHVRYRETDIEAWERSRLQPV